MSLKHKKAAIVRSFTLTLRAVFKYYVEHFLVKDLSPGKAVIMEETKKKY